MYLTLGQVLCTSHWYMLKDTEKGQVEVHSLLEGRPANMVDCLGKK